MAKFHAGRRIRFASRIGPGAFNGAACACRNGNCGDPSKLNKATHADSGQTSPPLTKVPENSAAKHDATAEDVSAWAADRLTSRAGSSVKAGLLQQDFAAWASDRGILLPNNWPNRFGAILADLGYQKVKVRTSSTRTLLRARFRRW